MFSWFWYWNEFDNRWIFDEVKAYKTVCQFSWAIRIEWNAYFYAGRRQFSSCKVFYHCSPSFTVVRRPHFKSREITTVSVKLSVDDVELLKECGTDMSFVRLDRRVEYKLTYKSYLLCVFVCVCIKGRPRLCLLFIIDGAKWRLRLSASGASRCYAWQPALRRPLSLPPRPGGFWLKN